MQICDDFNRSENGNERGLIKDCTSSEYILLPAGTYRFIIYKVEISWSDASESKEPHEVIHIAMRIPFGNDGKCAFCHTWLHLTGNCWAACKFLLSIGVLQPGGTIEPEWEAYKGYEGMARFKPRKYVDKNGVEREVNSVEAFLNREGPSAE